MRRQCAQDKVEVARESGARVCACVLVGYAGYCREKVRAYLLEALVVNDAIGALYPVLLAVDFQADLNSYVCRLCWYGLRDLCLGEQPSDQGGSDQQGHACAVGGLNGRGQQIHVGAAVEVAPVANRASSTSSGCIKAAAALRRGVSNGQSHHSKQDQSYHLTVFHSFSSFLVFTFVYGLQELTSL